VDHRLRTKADANQDGIQVELVPLLAPYGRDRRVAMRIERMPSRARLSRGRNNGDGSWSLTRDELEGVLYIPAKGAQEQPTLVVRIIDTDNGSTLAVLDFAVAPENEPDESDFGDETDHEKAAQREVELRQLRSELAKAKASLRAIHTEFTAARKSFEQELEQHLSEAAEEAAAAIERNRGAWHAETRERLAKAESRAQEKIAQALERGRREAEAELSEARDEAAHGEQTRSASQDAELARLRRELSAMRAALADQEKKVAAAQSASALARDDARREAVIAFAKAEEGWKKEETERLAAAQAKWHAQSERALKEATNRVEQAEAALAEAGAKQSVRDRRDTEELRRLRDELENSRSALSEREAKLAESQVQAKLARDELQREAAVALANMEKEWRAGEAQRFAAAEEKWTRQSARTLKETAERLERAEAALAETRAESRSSRERRDTNELRRLRAELAAAEKKLAERDGQLLETEQLADRARKRSEAIEAALAKAAEEWRGEETGRLAAAEKRWQEQSAHVIAESEKKLARAVAELAAMRADVDGARRQHDPVEMRRLRELFAETQLTLAKRDGEVAEARAALKQTAERAEREKAAALAEVEKRWEVRAQEESERLMKKATMKLEAAEAALAEARAEANATHDRRDSAEFRRLRAEFAALREKLSERETELAEAQFVTGRTRERTRQEIESALAKAEEAWKSSEAIRIADVEASERARGVRAAAEAEARSERSEVAFREARSQLESERESSAVALAEANARIERLESHVSAARTRIEAMRDPVNETELHRLRTELAAIQIAYGEREAELAQARAATRKTRERWTEHVQAAVMRAEETWRIEEAERLSAARREWERDAKIASAIEAEPEADGGHSRLRRANRLALDCALAVGFAALVVLGVTMYPRLSGFWPTAAPASGSEPPKRAAVQQHAEAPAAPAAALRAVVSVAAANMRAAPASSSDIVAKLPLGSEVTVIERRTNWTHVEIAAAGGKAPRDGWIHGPSLKAIVVPAKAGTQ
jgi:hypothetical protein